MTVSVVIPCYNAAAYVGEAVASALRQTRPPDEVLVVDDGSTDGSPDVARRAGARVVATPRNAGASAARNVGAREARGELVAWLDADDYWDDVHLATVVPLLERFPEAVLAFSRVQLFGAREGEWPALLPEGRAVDAFAACLRRCVLPQNAVVVRRAALLDAGGYDESMPSAEDYDLWLRLSRAFPFVCTHDITGHWRQHDRNLGGDLLRYQRNEYESRWRLWRNVAASPEPAEGNGAPALWRDRAALGAAMRHIWIGHLLTAWWMRDRTHMAFHLSMRHLVPESDALHATWRRRARLLPLARAYDRLRAGARALR